jgi:hypothetical protein
MTEEEKLQRERLEELLKHRARPSREDFEDAGTPMLEEEETHERRKH